MTNTILLSPHPLTDSEQDCVDKLAEALEQAKLGNIHSLGLVACMKKGYAIVIAGTAAGEINLGCDSLKQQIREIVEGDRRSSPKIMKVR